MSKAEGDRGQGTVERRSASTAPRASSDGNEKAGNAGLLLYPRSPIPYFPRYTILPFVRSYGVISTVTLSPVRIRM